MTLYDEQLAAFLDQGPERGPTATLDDALQLARALPQRPAWLVTLRGGTVGADPAVSLLRFGWIPIAMAAMLALLVGVLGGWPRPRPEPVPLVPRPSPSTVAALIWSPASMEMDWPLPVREEPAGPAVQVAFDPAPSLAPERSAGLH